MAEDYSFLPATLAEIAEVAGLPAALALAEKYGGARLHFPVRAAANHWLVECVGREAADKLCAHFRTTQRGGFQLDIPLGPAKFYARARKKALELLVEGVSTYEIARRLGVARCTVLRLKSSVKNPSDESKQGNLF
jgi:hypothetical protein